jgi:hypothetical protein
MSQSKITSKQTHLKAKLFREPNSGLRTARSSILHFYGCFVSLEGSMSSLKSFLPSSSKKPAAVGPPRPDETSPSDDPFASLPKNFGRRAASVSAPPPVTLKKSENKRDRNEFGERVKTKEEKEIEAAQAEMAAQRKAAQLYQVKQGDLLVFIFLFQQCSSFSLSQTGVEDEKHRPAPWSDELALSSHVKTVLSLDFEP